MYAWSLSITVSTTGFHPVNAGSTPAEITTLKSEPEDRARRGLFFVVNSNKKSAN